MPRFKAALQELASTTAETIARITSELDGLAVEIGPPHMRTNGWCSVCGGTGRADIEHVDR